MRQTGSQARRHGFDTLAFPGQQQPSTVVLQRLVPIGMPRGVSQALDICREAPLLLSLIHIFHAARQPSVIPPVGHESRYALGVAFVVHHHDQKVSLLAQHARDFELERREAAHVFAQLLAVEEHDGVVVGRSEPDLSLIHI